MSANHILVLTIFYDMSPSSKAMRFFHTWFATRSDSVGSYLRFGLFAVMLILLNFESSSLLIRFVTATTPGLNNLSLYKGSSVVLWWSCRVGDTCFLYQWRFIMKLHGRLYSGLMLYLKWRVGVFMCWARIIAGSLYSNATAARHDRESNPGFHGFYSRALPLSYLSIPKHSFL